MSVLRTHAASAMLGVSPNTLRSWERRFGFPTPRRTSGGHRQFDLAEIEALRQAFEETHNVSSAISVARARGSGPSSPIRLRSALRRFEEIEADRILEESLAVRSVERTVVEVLIPAINGLLPASGEPASPELTFGLNWGTGWIASAKRVAPPSTRHAGVLIFDASTPNDIDALHARALELCLRRVGIRALLLAADNDACCAPRVIQTLTPRVIVFSGRRDWLGALSQIAYQARRTSEPVEVLAFREALKEREAPGVPRLGADAVDARDLVVAHLNTLDAASRSSGAVAQTS